VEWRILDRLSATRSGLRRLYWAREAAKLRREEARLLRAAEVVLATSEVDRAGFREIAPGHRVEVVGPSIPVSRDAARRRPPAGPPCFVFTGAFDWHVNQAAALWLCREALPRLRERLRAIRVHLVGKEPSVTVRELAAIPEVTVTGAVPDVRPHLLAATAAIVPLQYGSGVRYKILEACAAGTPVVSTSCGCEGLGMESERHLLVADGADLFARACARLATDGELWSRLSAAGTGFVRETNEASARAFAAVIGGLVGARNLGAPQPLSLSMGSST
jgi:glycosyltransferase involved in cell wall biosynthesis